MKSFDLWLRKQVLKMEHDISTNPVFDSGSEPTRDELLELRRLTVIHRFLNNNLEQIETTYRKSATPLDKTRTDWTKRRDVA